MYVLVLRLIWLYAAFVVPFSPFRSIIDFDSMADVVFVERIKRYVKNGVESD